MVSARGLNGDQAVKAARLSGCKNFVGKRKFIFNAFDVDGGCLSLSPRYYRRPHMV